MPTLSVTKVVITSGSKVVTVTGNQAALFNTTNPTVPVTFTALVTATADNPLLPFAGRYTAQSATYISAQNATEITIAPTSVVNLANGTYTPTGGAVVTLDYISTYDLGGEYIYPSQTVSNHGLTFVGKGALTWGEVYAKNFKSLASNFAGAAAPANPFTGQMWFNTSSGQLKIWDGTEWDTMYTVDAASYPYHTFTSSTTWVVNHGLELPAPYIAVVSCFVDEAGSTKAILPADIAFNGANQLTVTFTQPRSGYVIVRP
jgi:hypothetical protein